MAKVAVGSAVDISISVVSHLQIGMVVELLRDFEVHCKNSRFELILTLNLEEALPFAPDDFSYPVIILRNAKPLGFGANHNQAYRHASGRYFCVVNPDIRLQADPFVDLLPCLEDSSVGVVAPLVRGADGRVEDSARRFPGPLKILGKALGRGRGPDYAIQKAPIHPDWVGGMFMVFPSEIFGKLGGFDERYFLYYEDVDLCGRLRLRGHEVVLNPKAQVIHHAQRSSHGNLRYMAWHLKSMARFFFSPVYWRLRCHRRP